MSKILIDLEDSLYNRLEKLSRNYKFDKNILIEQAIRKSLPSIEEGISKVFVSDDSDLSVITKQEKIQDQKSITLKIKLKASHISYGFLYIPKGYRKYFPEPTKDHIEDNMFVISTDIGDFKTHLEGGFRTPHLTEWFKKNKNILVADDFVCIDIIEPFKKYKLRLRG